jgi:hypothetical protein
MITCINAGANYGKIYYNLWKSGLMKLDTHQQKIFQQSS